jgi:dihydrodipicolinate synthase/N-acetylneuraminate lyase
MAGDLKRAFELQHKLNACCFIAMRYGLLMSFEMILRYLGYWDRAFRRPNRRFDEELYNKFIAEAGSLVHSLAAIT